MIVPANYNRMIWVIAPGLPNRKTQAKLDWVGFLTKPSVWRWNRNFGVTRATPLKISSCYPLPPPPSFFFLALWGVQNLDCCPLISKCTMLDFILRTDNQYVGWASRYDSSRACSQHNASDYHLEFTTLLRHFNRDCHWQNRYAECGDFFTEEPQEYHRRSAAGPTRQPNESGVDLLSST